MNIRDVRKFVLIDPTPSSDPNAGRLRQSSKIYKLESESVPAVALRDVDGPAVLEIVGSQSEVIARQRADHFGSYPASIVKSQLERLPEAPAGYRYCIEAVWSTNARYILVPERMIVRSSDDLPKIHGFDNYGYFEAQTLPGPIPRVVYELRVKQDEEYRAIDDARKSGNETARDDIYAIIADSNYIHVRADSINRLITALLNPSNTSRSAKEIVQEQG